MFITLWSVIQELLIILFIDTKQPWVFNISSNKKHLTVKWDRCKLISSVSTTVLLHRIYYLLSKVSFNLLLRHNFLLYVIVKLHYWSTLCLIFWKSSDIFPLSAQENKITLFHSITINFNYVKNLNLLYQKIHGNH